MFLVNFIKSIFNFKAYRFKHAAFSVLFLVYLLGGIGAYLIKMLQDADERLYQKHVMGLLLGLGVILVISLIDYHFIAKWFVVLYLINIALLLICRYSNSLPIYGWSHYEARRWIKIGGDPTAGANNKGFEFMPSEVTKIAMIIFIAKFFDICYKKIQKIWVLLLAIALMGVPTLMIFMQPDLSTTICLAMIFAVLVFVSGVPYKFIFSIVAILTPILIGVIWYVQQDFQVLLTYWQQRRVLAALHPEDYPDLMYQQSNAKAAIQSGGMIGKFLAGEGLKGTYYVPVKESDFIFTAVAEGFGFIGAIAVLMTYFLMIVLIIRIGKRAKDYLGMMLAIGIGALISVQVFINIGVVTSLLPNTGIPLPFMSSGLSALLINLVTIGILINISMQPKEDVPKHNDEFEFLE
ncbi:MAG: FtsW/RodA/SpoVE family cell cycle protein [Lachnospiraceae bacterium]|nr:FtsW/RodA/SpoVE family cell cycle protein [Lachnospiraceae bacterium]